MPDIFGRTAQDYQIVRALQEAELWDRYQQDGAVRRPASTPTHDFNALQSGVPSAFERATEDAQAVGYLTNNMLAIQTMVDEVLYAAYRLPDFVHINTDIPEGARSYGVRVRDRRGRAQRISGPGFEAPSATRSEALKTVNIHWYGLDAEWSIDELRGAMMSGVPLDTESVEAAVTGTLETMEAVALTGGDYDEHPGLLNQPISGTDAVTRTVQDANATFADLTSVQIRNLINGRISNIIEITKEALGRTVTMGMTVYLPGPQYDLLTTRYIGDNAERTLMRSIIEDNPWTHFTNGSPLMIERVLELSGRGTNLGQGGTVGAGAAVAADRMVVALKHTRVAEIGVSIAPRVLRIMDRGRVVCAQVEAKFSPLFPKRPNTIHYVDAI